MARASLLLFSICSPMGISFKTMFLLLQDGKLCCTFNADCSILDSSMDPISVDETKETESYDAQARKKLRQLFLQTHNQQIAHREPWLWEHVMSPVLLMLILVTRKDLNFIFPNHGAIPKWIQNRD